MKRVRKSSPTGIVASIKTIIRYDGGTSNTGRLKDLEKAADEMSLLFSPDYELSDLRAWIGRRLSSHPNEFISLAEAVAAPHVARRTVQEPKAKIPDATRERMKEMKGKDLLALANGDVEPQRFKKKETDDA